MIGFLLAIGCSGLLGGVLFAQASAETLPLRGVAHVGIQVSDLDQSRAFYHDVLGFEQLFRLPAPGGQETAVACFKINDQQFIEIFPGLQPDQPAPIRYVGLYADDIEKVHQMLASRGIATGPIGKSREGNLEFSIPHPPGLELMSLEFVQYLPGSLHRAAEGKSLGSRRIGTCVNHVGLVASDLNEGQGILRRGAWIPRGKRQETHEWHGLRGAPRPARAQRGIL